MKVSYDIRIPSSRSDLTKISKQYEQPFLEHCISPIRFTIEEKGKPETQIKLFEGNKEELDFEKIEKYVQVWGLSVIQSQLPRNQLKAAVRFAKGFWFTMTWTDLSG